MLTHRVWGALIFAVVMLALFQALFSWSEPAIDFIQTQHRRRSRTSSPARCRPARSPISSTDGIIAGVGNVVAFVPQIALLFLFIGVMEDVGYLARVAFVIDRVMGRVGLHGKSFVPMLSGFSCAVPAVMATRTLEHRTDRMLTMAVLPLMSCSARLPVYVLVIATVFRPGARVFGVASAGAVTLFCDVSAVGDGGADRGGGAAAHGAERARDRRWSSSCRRTAVPWRACCCATRGARSARSSSMRARRSWR